MRDRYGPPPPQRFLGGGRGRGSILTIIWCVKKKTVFWGQKTLFQALLLGYWLTVKYPVFFDGSPKNTLNSVLPTFHINKKHDGFISHAEHFRSNIYLILWFQDQRTNAWSTIGFQLYWHLPSSAPISIGNWSRRCCCKEYYYQPYFSCCCYITNNKQLLFRVLTKELVTVYALIGPAGHIFNRFCNLAEYRRNTQKLPNIASNRLLFVLLFQWDGTKIKQGSPLSIWLAIFSQGGGYCVTSAPG